MALKFYIAATNLFISLGAIYVLKHVKNIHYLKQVNLTIDDCLLLLIEFLIKEGLDEEPFEIRENQSAADCIKRIN